jgi:hypothetical protein
MCPHQIVVDHFTSYTRAEIAALATAGPVKKFTGRFFYACLEGHVEGASLPPPRLCGRPPSLSFSPSSLSVGSGFYTGSVVLSRHP